MSQAKNLGGIVHTYQKYDPKSFPSPTQPPPDVVSSAMEHMLRYGNMRELTDEELARAIRLDPSQIKGLGPSLESLMAMLLERKRKILAKYETQAVLREARKQYDKQAGKTTPPPPLQKAFDRATRQEQIYDLEKLFYAAGSDTSKFARQIVTLIETLGEKYQVDELAAKYTFT